MQILFPCHNSHRNIIDSGFVLCVFKRTDISENQEVKIFTQVSYVK